MKGRYLAIVGAASAARTRVERAAAELGLTLRLDQGNVLLLAEPETPTMIAPTGDVALVGTLFSRSSGYGHISELGSAEANAIVRSDGARLLSDYWGGYVALVCGGPSSTTVLRDPSGHVACYHGSADGVTAYSSDAALLCRLGFASGLVDWDFLTHHICYPLLRLPRTGITGIGNLLPGMRQRLRGGTIEQRDYVWSPWTFSVEAQIDDPAEARETVAEETLRCIVAWAGQSRLVLLELSGGLDSSIIAACLARRKCADVACVTLATSSSASDERRYARAVANHVGLPLTELMLEPRAADVRHPASCMTPYPDEEMLHRIIDDALVTHGDAIDADSYFSGGGGDNVFCYLSTASPAADMLLTHGPWRDFRRSIDDVARLHRCTHWTALHYAVRKAFWARPIVCRLEEELLARSAVVAHPTAHPWFVRPRGALPGKLEHVKSIAYGQWATDGQERARTANLRYPLLSQPLIELCLRIPTWLWIANGRNRAVARDAFRVALPRTILERRTKGDFTGFMGAVYQLNRERIRELLMDGELTARGLLDREAIDAAINGPEAPRDVTFARLLTLARVEVWAQTWSSAAKALSVAQPPSGSAA